MGSKVSKGMSGQYSTKGTPAAPVGAGRKNGSLSTNGNGPPPLTYADPEDDENMNEIHDENVDVRVHLPDGTTQEHSVESNIPMMDLLVNLAGKSRLNPASHSLVVLSEDKWKQIDFKANKTIGLLAGEDRSLSVQIVPKKSEDKVKTRPANQPFEMTYRLTVNLPHNQKKVFRISPKLSLGEIREMVCREKSFDPSRYIFQLPSKPGQPLSDRVIIGDLKTSEINFITAALLDSSMKSMPDLSQGQGYTTSSSSIKSNPESGGYMPSAGEKKTKRGLFSFLNRKDKKFKVDNTMDLESASMNRKNMRQEPQVRPKTMYVVPPSDGHPEDLRRTLNDNKSKPESRTDFRKSTGSNLSAVVEKASRAQIHESIPENPPPVACSSSNKGVKKRAAPPPPKKSSQQPQTIQVEIKVEPQRSDVSRIEDVPEARVPMMSRAHKLHSRNSSDSSGYHEITLSGAESPDSVKILETFKTSLDTTSLDSGDHFNGDSGIRDMSPARKRVSQESNSRGKLPMKEDDANATAANRKKKRAPPPPGVQKQDRDKSAQEDEDEALLAMEEVTMEFDKITEDDDMRMVEDESIRSEDGYIDKERSRPPQFIAPPPPTEPPPPEVEPVDYHAVNHINQVDTMDIGVGDETMSIDSAKNSPVRIRSRRDSSDSSSSSVNTLEDLSLAFKLTIAMGEEALESENVNDNVEDELKAAMPDFKDKISKLSEENLDGSQSGNTTGRSQVSELETDSDGSVIIHDSPKESGPDASAALDKSNSDNQSTGRASPVQSATADGATSEITYNFTIDSVPPEFQSEEEEELKPEEEEKEDSEEGEEEIEVYEEEIVTYVKRPNSMVIGSPRRIPDLDSPKEHRVFSLPAHEIFSDIPVDESTPKPKESVQVSKKEVEEVKKEKPKPAEKEEFVISLDDLQNIDFSAGQKRGKKKPTVVVRKDNDIQRSMQFQHSDDSLGSYGEQNSFNIDFVDGVDVDSENRDVKNKVSELSFTPNSEEEMGHVMEEKSISSIAHPFERNHVKSSESSDTTFESDKPTYSSSTKIVLSSSRDGSVEPSPRSTTDSVPSDDSSEAGSQTILQQQYQQLQQQFLMWQTQLAQNQKLLANQTPTNQMAAVGSVPAGDDQSNQFQQLNMQIMLQQQMLMQLQQSMQHLAVQNTITANTGSQPVQPQIEAVSQVGLNAPVAPVVLVAPPAPPPAPVPPPAKPKVAKTDAKYTKPKTKKIEAKLDPREQLMLDIRNYKGRTGLKTVPVKATHWHNA